MLRLDPVSGFMVSSRDDGVSSQIKTDILEVYRRTGNLSEASRAYGIAPGLTRWHMGQDPEFKRQIDECRQQICDKAEGHIVQWMGEQKNVIDRLAWLRAYRPGTWNPKTEHSVTHNVEVTARLADKARQAVNTTAVPVDSPDKGGATATSTP